MWRGKVLPNLHISDGTNGTTNKKWIGPDYKILKNFQLDVILDGIEKMSLLQLSSLVKKEEKINTLNKIKARHYKVNHIPYTVWKMEDYLRLNQSIIREYKFLIAPRCRMMTIRGNYSVQHENTRFHCVVNK